MICIINSLRLVSYNFLEDLRELKKKLFGCLLGKLIGDTFLNLISIFWMWFWNFAREFPLQLGAV